MVLPVPSILNLQEARAATVSDETVAMDLPAVKELGSQAGVNRRKTAKNLLEGFRDSEIKTVMSWQS